MAIPFLRNSRFLRALVLTTAVFGFLAWLYIVARVVVNHVDPPEPFLNSFPSVSFSAVGAFSFGLSALSMFVYLWLWGGFGRRPTIPGSPPQREP